MRVICKHIVCDMLPDCGFVVHGTGLAGRTSIVCFRLCRWVLQGGRNLTGDQLPSTLALYPHTGYTWAGAGVGSGTDSCHLRPAFYGNSRVAVDAHDYVFYGGGGEFHES